ncbi:MAG: S-layer homology domain-containing protein, partial [Oscillospiraceae bacterium]|nr:S-layer homology domain-containing protein [Oscillospiraceae bacterium]
ALDELTVTDSQGNKIELTDKGDGTFTFKMPSRKVTVTAAFVSDGSYSTCPGDHTCPIWPYTDAETTAWYHDGVHYIIEKGLMTGYGNGIFKPNTDTSRAMIAVMLWRLEGSPVVNYLLDFEDVKAEAWYTEAIRWAKSEGIIGGYGNGCWGPDDAVTREQMVTILWRYAQYKGYDVSVGENTNILSYDDAFDVAEYAIPAMQWACGSDMVQGMNDPDGEGMILAPESKGTRAQIATMIMRFCEEILK